MTTEVTSGAPHVPVETLFVADMTADELREWVSPPWPKSTREQLLAYFKNRHIEFFKRVMMTAAL